MICGWSYYYVHSLCSNSSKHIFQVAKITNWPTFIGAMSLLMSFRCCLNSPSFSNLSNRKKYNMGEYRLIYRWIERKIDRYISLPGCNSCNLEKTNPSTSCSATSSFVHKRNSSLVGMINCSAISPCNLILGL